MFIIFTDKRAKVVKSERNTSGPLSTIKSSRPLAPRLSFESSWVRLKKILKDRHHVV